MQCIIQNLFREHPSALLISCFIMLYFIQALASQATDRTTNVQTTGNNVCKGQTASSWSLLWRVGVSGIRPLNMSKVKITLRGQIFLLTMFNDQFSIQSTSHSLLQFVIIFNRPDTCTRLTTKLKVTLVEQRSTVGNLYLVSCYNNIQFPF